MVSPPSRRRLVDFTEGIHVRSWRLRSLVLAIFFTALALPAHADEELVKSGTFTLGGWRVSYIGSASKFTGVLSLIFLCALRTFAGSAYGGV